MIRIAVNFMGKKLWATEVVKDAIDETR